ncbi:MAG: hypothetical protein LC803_10265 [Acidobacteria bacterium]|nr:hypothetical protein [Acidobacteriota bacterium]
MNKKRLLAFICLATFCAALVPASLAQRDDRRRPPRHRSKSQQRRITSNKADARITELMTQLRGQKVKAERAGKISQPFFSVEGQGINVNGENVQVFVYASESAAKAEAIRVSPDGGSVGTSMMSWMAPPHFYRKGELIVLYVGSEQAVIDALVAVLGAQFAGR